MRRCSGQRASTSWPSMCWFVFGLGRSWASRTARKSASRSLRVIVAPILARPTMAFSAAVPLRPWWRASRASNAMKEGLPRGGRLRRVTTRASRRRPRGHVARWFGSQSPAVDYCLLGAGSSEPVGFGAVSPDADGLAGLARLVELRHGRPAVSAVIESMNGARFVHDTLERCGWDVQVADAARVKGFAPVACKTDRIDAWVLAELSRRDMGDCPTNCV